jgi:hypothetical protein
LKSPLFVDFQHIFQRESLFVTGTVIVDKNYRPVNSSENYPVQVHTDTIQTGKRSEIKFHNVLLDFLKKSRDTLILCAVIKILSLDAG